LTQRAGRFAVFQSGPFEAAHWVTLLLLFGVGHGGFECCSLARKPFWFDETFSVEVARLDWRKLPCICLWWRESQTCRCITFLLRVCGLHLGQSEFILFAACRSCSRWANTARDLLAGGKLLYDRRTAVIAMALLAFKRVSHPLCAGKREVMRFWFCWRRLSSAFLIAYLRTADRAHRLGYTVVSVLGVYAPFLCPAAGWRHNWLGLNAGFGSPEQHPGRKRADQFQVSCERHLDRYRASAVLPLLVFRGEKPAAGPHPLDSSPRVCFDLVRFLYRPDRRPSR